MTKPEYLEFAENTLNGVLETVKRKNNDYTAGTDDPFNNFRLAKLEGVDPSVGILIRLQDKLQRIRTYLNTGKLMVEGEGFEDACDDVIGYMLLLKGLETEKAENVVDAAS